MMRSNKALITFAAFTENLKLIKLYLDHNVAIKRYKIIEIDPNESFSDFFILV
jgi:hypothetical protein